METPKIIIDGREYTPTPPKMRTWRDVIEFDDTDKDSLKLSEIATLYVGGIVKIYGRPEVTAEAVEANLDAADIIPAYNEAARWVVRQIFAGLEKVPNADAAGE